MSENGGPRYFMTRVLSQREPVFQYLFKKPVVAIGWSNVDLSGFPDPHQAAAAVRAAYPQATGRHVAAIHRFLSIRPGDRIVVPYHGSVVLAFAGERRVYDRVAGAEFDLANQLEVSYLRTTDGEIAYPSRDTLPEGLARRLRVPGSIVLDLGEFASELEARFENPATTWDNQYAKAEEERRGRFARELMERIRGGATNLRAGGLGLEHLVKELVECEGYQARIVPKRMAPAGADADIVATRSDQFGSTQLLIQVKHHGGLTGVHAVKQLLRMDEVDGAYADYQKVVVTSATASEELNDDCRANDVQLIEGKELGEWILRALPRLQDSTLATLGISRVPQLVDL